jgi:hypothetical protein
MRRRSRCLVGNGRTGDWLSEVHPGQVATADRLLRSILYAPRSTLRRLADGARPDHLPSANLAPLARHLMSDVRCWMSWAGDFWSRIGNQKSPRPKSTTCSVSHACSHTKYSAISGVSEPASVLDFETVTSTYINRRCVGVSLQQPPSTWTNGFGWHLAGRLTNVTSAVDAHGYICTPLIASSSGRRVAAAPGRVCGKYLSGR